MLPTEEMLPERPMQQSQKQNYRENYDDRVRGIQEEEK